MFITISFFCIILQLSHTEIRDIYGTRHIGRDHARSLVGLMDFFCFSEVSSLLSCHSIITSAFVMCNVGALPQWTVMQCVLYSSYVKEDYCYPEYACHKVTQIIDYHPHIAFNIHPEWPCCSIFLCLSPVIRNRHRMWGKVTSLFITIVRNKFVPLRAQVFWCYLKKKLKKKQKLQKSSFGALLLFQ